MKQQQSGFTLIELVMVIVILGILAATAIPKFQDLSTDAQNAATDGIGGALGAASAINMASRSVSTGHGVAVTNCTDVSSALDGGLPTGYAITAGAISAGGTATCTVTGPDSTSTTFTGHGIN